jgi:hypothetical protein
LRMFVIVRLHERHFTSGRGRPRWRWSRRGWARRRVPRVPSSDPVRLQARDPSHGFQKTEPVAPTNPFLILLSRIRECLLDASPVFPRGLSPGGAAVSSPGREPRVPGGRGETSPSPEGATDALPPALSPLRGSDVGAAWPVPGLAPWATNCRPSGAERQTNTCSYVNP